MTERNSEHWLDEQLREIIGINDPQFDAEAWKRKHGDEYRALTARGHRDPSAAQSRRLRTILLGAGGLAAAAVVLLAVGLLWDLQQEAPNGFRGSGQRDTFSPARMVTVMSLSTTFREGGMEALERQLDLADEKLGPRPGDDSLASLWSDLES